MTVSTSAFHPRMVLAACCLLWASASAAQSPQAPLTGQMMGGTSPAPAPLTAPAERLPMLDLTAPAPAAAAATPPASATTYAAAAASSTASTTPPVAGSTVRHLFQLQASGTQAGARLPILGDQATASYARYLKSFDHEIPDFFETDVTPRSGASGSGR